MSDESRPHLPASPISDSSIPIARPSEPRVLRPRRAAPADAVRPTRAEVNLATLRHNLRVVERSAGSTEVWSVLKADGYGHGSPAVARTLERAGVKGFCVALLEEAIELREAGIGAPILVMGGYYADAHAEFLARHLIPVVYDEAQIDGFARAARLMDISTPVPVHLKVDTGMARLGATLDRLPQLADKIVSTPEIAVTGLMTHLAQADALSTDEIHAQIAKFDEASVILARMGINPKMKHAGNSAALLRKEALLDMIRPGIALFGVSPSLPTNPASPLSTELQPSMRVRSEIVDLRRVDAGALVGYGGQWRASRPSMIATFPMGYADGLSRSLSNKGSVLVRGKRAPIVGTISMDMSMIDVTDSPGVTMRDEVVVLGAQDGPLGKDAITAEEIAFHAGTIPWEVLTSISRRVPRFYREP